MAVVTDGIRGALRIGQTLSVLGRTGVDWLRGDRPPAPRMLRQTFERLGATYIKLGQFIASSPTFFPKEYVDEFQYCLDRTPSLPFGEIRKLIARELDQPLETVFSHIEPTALASASIAQVHGARLVTGERVVIKVQKPGVEATLGTDLNFLSLSARVIDTLAPKLSWASLSGIAREIQQSMMEECDFHQEAANLQAFRRFLDATDNQAVTVPRVYGHCSTRRILTMERFDGVPLTDLDSVRQVTADPEGTLISAMNTWFSSLTRCEFFHADVHAGNLMVLKDGRVGFIDFGIVGRIRPETWQAVRDFGGTFLAQDFNGMADAMTRIGVTGANADRQALARDLQRLAQEVESPSENPSRVEEDVNELLMEVVRVGENHGLHFPREFALLLKQFLYFDRYVHILAPGMDMLKDERLTLMH